MPIIPIGGGQVQPNQLAPQNAQAGQVQTLTGRISAFFGALASGVAHAFTSFAGAVASLAAHGANAAAAVFAPQATGEKGAMLAEFRASDMYRAVQEGGTLNKKSLETGAERILSTPEALETMKANGLTLTEAVAIFIYTTGDYTPINEQLRNDAVSPEVRVVTEMCVAGMAKLPSHDETVTRLVQLPDHIVNAHVEGAEVEYEAFTSTSSNQGGDANFFGNMFMLIEPKPGSAGKDVSMFSNVPSEQEILFPPGSRFHILERKEPETNFAMMGMMMGNPHALKINLVMAEV